MRNFILFILCFIALPAWAAPSLTDLDSWQLPEVEPLPAAPVQPVPASEPATPKKAKKVKEKGKELKVQLTENNAYAVAKSTRDASEIDIMNLTAQQLMSKFAGQGRFYILFNANMPANIDTEVVAEDGADYALSVFGNETKKYRMLLFKGGLEQPLIAAADDVRGKLNIMQKYRIELEVTEDEMKKSYPSLSPQEITGKEDEKTYHAYKLEGPLFVVFQGGKFIRQFNTEEAFTTYSNDLQGIVPKPEVDTRDPRQPNELEPSDPRSRLPDFRRDNFNPSDPRFRFQDRNGDVNPDEMRPGFSDPHDPWNPDGLGAEHKRLFSQIVGHYQPRSYTVTKADKNKTAKNRSKKSAKGKKTSPSKRRPSSKTNPRNRTRR